MDCAVVDHRIPGRRRVQDLLRHALILGEQVQTQRARPRVDEVDHLLDVIDLQDRKNRAEDLFLHHRRVRRHVHQHRRRDEPVRAVVLTSVENGPARQQRRQPIEVTRVDDSAVVRAFLGIAAVELDQRFLEVFQERSGDILEHKDIVGRGTGLAGVVPPALGDAAGRDAQVGRRMDDGRAFAAKFEDDGR